MAYSSALLHCAFSPSSRMPRIWFYFHNDTVTDIDADGYISDAWTRGLRKNDLVFAWKVAAVTDTDAAVAAAPSDFTIHVVESAGTESAPGGNISARLTAAYATGD